jgi:peptide/nickel transport system permease protein
MPIILWTDALIYLLLAILIWLIITTARKDFMRAQWRKAYGSPIKMIALVILIFYTIIGVVDSLHYIPKLGTNSEGKPIYAAKINSVLDWLLKPNSEQLETSYSPPFATELFNKEMIKEESGQISWTAVRLKYVTEAKILPLLIKGVTYGLIAWLIVFTIAWLIFVKWLKFSFPRGSPWRVATYTLLAICILSAVCVILAQHYHILGTDKIGTDIFYASIKSIRTGLVIGTLTTFITLPFAILLGAMAGYYRGWIDDIVQYIYTTLSSVPAVLLIAAAVLTMDAALQRHETWFNLMAQRADIRLLLLCCILGLTSWTSLCRFVRGETLKLRELAFVQASRALGLGSMQIIIKHILPNLLHIILISIVLDFSGLVLAEAVLSYVGVGVDPSMYSWGNMINSARMELGREPIIWWTLTGAFVLMFTLVLAANIFADGVRDAFDPRMN